MYALAANVDAGGLMGYGPNDTACYKQAAGFVDKILKGAKPADMPVEQPTRFDLALNVIAAKELGLVIPSEQQLRAASPIRAGRCWSKTPCATCCACRV